MAVQIFHVREQPRRAIEKSGMNLGEIVDSFDVALEGLKD
jgi:hypothetical protein